MRIRATVAAVSGALALSALAVPAAQADDAVSRADTAKVLAAGQSASGKAAFTAAVDGTPYALDVSFSGVTVNKGKNIAVGTTKTVNVPVTFTMTHGADVDITAPDFVPAVDLYRGTSFDDSEWDFVSDVATCTATTETTASCTTTVAVDPEELVNEDAGTWKAAGFAVAYNGEDPTDENLDLSKVGVAVQDGVVPAYKLQRFSKLTVNASPEPVKKNKTITVKGTLTRANWTAGKYAGYTVQPVALQFKKKGATSYTTVKTIKSGTAGALKTTVKATADGYFRYNFAGTSTTPAVKAAGDYVDVN